MLILLGAATICMSGLYASRETVATACMPLLSAVTEAIATDFSINAMDTVQQGPSRYLRVRANLRHRIDLDGTVLYPFGTQGMPQGEIQVRITVGGIFVYSVFLLAIVVAWPVKSMREGGSRLLAALILTGALLFLDLPFTITAELWKALYQHYAPRPTFPWMVWSRFMMGGGGFVLAATFAAVAIKAGQAASSLPKRATLLRAPNVQVEETKEWNLRRRLYREND